jgi:hypothetical protein
LTLALRACRNRVASPEAFIFFFFIRMYRSRFTPPAIAVLPQAPKNASPVPGLTSLFHKRFAGPYGDRSYPGNCSGELIKDVLKYFQPKHVYDPMAGSGTLRDVCTSLKIECCDNDIRNGYDACDPEKVVAYTKAPPFDFIWAHPPYWRQKHYSDKLGDLSNAATLEEFLDRYGRFIRVCASVLKPGGKLAILMGDYPDREAGFVPLVYHTQRLCFEAGLTQACTQIVRFSHGVGSSKKVYKSSFIPMLHDVLTVVEKAK